MEVACGMPLILLDDVGAGDADGDFAARGFGIGIEAIAAPILDLGFFFALILPDLSRVSNLLARFKVAKWGGVSSGDVTKPSSTIQANFI